MGNTREQERAKGWDAIVTAQVRAADVWPTHPLLL